MKRSQQGFVLPLVLLVSVVMIAIGLSLVQTTASIRTSLTGMYMNKIAAETSEAGIVYANYCLNKDGSQKWDASANRPLTPETDCSGNKQPEYQKYLINYRNYQTLFTVGDIDTSSTNAPILHSSGTINTLALGGNSPYTLNHYDVNQKQVVAKQKLKASFSSSGVYKTCAVINAEAYCWGTNNSLANGEKFEGQLGDGTTNNAPKPVKVLQENGFMAGKDIVKVAAAQYHVCALSSDGKVFCWGNNDYGQLGRGGAGGYEKTPQKVLGKLASETVTDITTAGNTSCAIASGKIYCWGYNQQGSVGANSTQPIYTNPEEVSTAGGLPSDYLATKLQTSSSRSYNMCAIADGKAYCWGNNEAGQVGNGTKGPTDVLAPSPVDTSGELAGKTVTSIAQDGEWNQSPVYPHTCVVADASVYCWGDNAIGQLGIGTYSAGSKYPKKVLDNPAVGFYNDNIADTSSGLEHECALRLGKVYCWGFGAYGQLGTGDFNSSNLPVKVKDDGQLKGLTVTSISGGGNRGCAIANFSTYCWGLNLNYQLGDGTMINRNEPTKSLFLEPRPGGFLF